jgi:hypothetical protein
MTRQLHPRRSTILKKNVAGRCRQVQGILQNANKKKNMVKT